MLKAKSLKDFFQFLKDGKDFLEALQKFDQAKICNLNSLARENNSTAIELRIAQFARFARNEIKYICEYIYLPQRRNKAINTYSLIFDTAGNLVIGLNIFKWLHRNELLGNQKIAGKKILYRPIMHKLAGLPAINDKQRHTRKGLLTDSSDLSVLLKNEKLDQMFKGANLSGAYVDICFSLRRTNLSGLNLFGANLENSLLEGAILDDTCLDSACLRGCMLKGVSGLRCSLIEADLCDAKMYDDKKLTFNTNFSYANFSRANLTGASLSYANFTGAQFIHAYADIFEKEQNLQLTFFSYGIFINAKFDNSIFNDLKGYCANFANTSWQGAIITNGSLDKTDFSNADCTGCNFYKCDMQDANLRNAIFKNASLEKINFFHALLDDTNFENANLYCCNLSGSKCQEVIFTKAKLDGSNLTDTYLKNSTLEDASLKRANLFHANLNGASFKNANLCGSDLGKSNCENTIFINSQLTECICNNANMRSANFSHANMANVVLTYANCFNATFYGANLNKANANRSNFENADLTEADCTGIDFELTNLRGANLTNTKLEDANLTKAELSNTIKDNNTKSAPETQLEPTANIQSHSNPVMSATMEEVVVQQQSNQDPVPLSKNKKRKEKRKIKSALIEEREMQQPVQGLSKENHGKSITAASSNFVRNTQSFWHQPACKSVAAAAAITTVVAVTYCLSTMAKNSLS